MSRRRQKRDRAQVPEFSGFKPTCLTPRNNAQRDYLRAMDHNDIVLCHGPPGSGKTHLAAGKAVKSLRDGKVEKIVICRPVVSVGKDIGYLPGTKDEKIGPYLTPLFDELSYYVEQSKIKAWSEHGTFEIVPLSMMRGRTFNNCFVILDEAQNAVTIEIKTLLTRIGINTTMVLCGDLGQSDLPQREQGAFQRAIDKLSSVRGIAVVNFGLDDIVRHHLIQDIEELL